MSWASWQLIDSGFPSGAFAHSAGLEAAHQCDMITSLPDFIANHLSQIATSALPIVMAIANNPEDFEEADVLWDITTTNHVARRASKSVGQATLATAAKSLGSENIVALRKKAKDQHLPCHQLTVFAAVAHYSEIEPAEIPQLFCFATVRDIASAAVRLGIIGPTQSQHVLRSLSSMISEVIDQAQQRNWRHPATSRPMLDIIQGQHDRLYSRLFYS